MNLFNKKSQQLVIDQETDTLIRGWAVVDGYLNDSVEIKVSSTKKSIVIKCDLFRPDVVRAGLHNTGLCGFHISLSKHSLVDPKLEIIGVSKSNVDLQPRLPLVFVHIPKTAGTSLRKGLEDYFGSNVILKNYGIKAGETTEWLRDCLPIKDRYVFRQNFEKGHYQVYLGHNQARNSIDTFPISHFISMVRKPVDQVISHYNHFKRWYEYQGSIQEFIKSPQFKNVQNNYLSQVRLGLVGFIGTTEKYNDSIFLLNKEYGYNLASREDNVNTENYVELDEDVIGLIVNHNKKDIELYKQCEALLEERLAIVQSGHRWTYGDIDVRDDSLVGCAYQLESDAPVTVQLLRSGIVVEEQKATQPRPSLLRYRVPRDGYVGFAFNIVKGTNAEDYQILVKGSRQNLRSIFII